MKVSQRLYEKALPIWESYFTHPFIQGMADGTLAKDKFQFYMIQDHKYLMEYAKVFALGVIKSRDEKDMRLFAAFIADTLNTENAVHQFFLKELGITQEDIERTPMCLNNDSYTNYMIAVAMKEGLAELTTAVLGFNAFILFSAITEPLSVAADLMQDSVLFLLDNLFNFYICMLLYGGMTMLVEWKQINARPSKKVLYLFTFPLFMLTYIPISLAALVRRVEWKPIRHNSSASLKAKNGSLT